MVGSPEPQDSNGDGSHASFILLTSFLMEPRRGEIIISINMKTSSLLSFYFLLAFIFFNLNTYAQIQTSNSTIIYFEKAGELSKHISSNEKY